MNKQLINANHRNESGQALLVVLLSLSVVLIIVLYIVSRSITDISLSTKDEEALRAFSAAEAGIERALVIGSSIPSTQIGDANFLTNVSSFAAGSTSVVYPVPLKSGNVANFWLTRPSENSFRGNQIRVCWGDTADINAQTPAIEASIIYTPTPGNLSTARIARAAYDANTARYTNNNFFSPATVSNCVISGQTFRFQATLNMTGISGYSTQNVLQVLKIRMLYNTTTAHKVGIDVSGSGSTLPSQGRFIDSQGSYGTSSRRIEVYQLHPAVPTVFDSVVFSQSGITK